MEQLKVYQVIDQPSALALAAENGDVDQVRIILQANNSTEITTVEKEDGIDWTSEKVMALHRCTSKNPPNALEIVNLLVASGVDVNATEPGSSFCLMPLHYAADNGNNEVVRVLLDHGANVEAKNLVLGSTALIDAASHGNANTVQLLLERGANVNEVDDEDHTALWYASKHGHKETVKALKARGAKGAADRCILQ